MSYKITTTYYSDQNKPSLIELSNDLNSEDIDIVKNNLKFVENNSTASEPIILSGLFGGIARALEKDYNANPDKYDNEITNYYEYIIKSFEAGIPIIYLENRGGEPYSKRFVNRVVNIWYEAIPNNGHLVDIGSLYFTMYYFDFPNGTSEPPVVELKTYQIIS